MIEVLIDQALSELRAVMKMCGENTEISDFLLRHMLRILERFYRMLQSPGVCFSTIFY